MKYSASCHCKAVKFELNCAKINQALQCNCSICSRKNALMSVASYDSSEFTLLSTNQALSVYHWGDKEVNHYFCKHCGVYPFHDTVIDPGRYRVNLGCIDGLEEQELEIIKFNGRDMYAYLPQALYRLWQVDCLVQTKFCDGLL